MPAELLITNIGFAISFLVSLSLGILVIVRKPKENAAPNIVLFFICMSLCVWSASYVIGVNLHDAYASRFAFMFNLSSLFSVLLNIHIILLFTGRYEARKNLLKVFYAIAVAIIAYYIAFPDAFLLASKPAMYLPNFFVPGSLYVIQDTFFFFLLIYLFTQVIAAYHKADYVTRNRLKYFIVSMLYAYTVALFPEFLLYGIQVDPILACITGFYVVPMVYSILKYDIVDLNVLAKRAFGYALSIAGVTLFILIIGYGNDSIHAFIPEFPQWLVPLGSAVIAVIVGVFIWKKVKEIDVLKYEFVDVVTHKFRTPLTAIGWSVQSLRDAATLPNERQQAVGAIADANERLLELTNMLTGLSSSDNSQYLYSFTPENLRAIVDETLEGVRDRVAEKKLSIEEDVPEALPPVYVDRQKMQFALQMIIENSIIYSPRESRIMVGTKRTRDFVTLSVRDSGIGITKEDMSRLFVKFFRSSEATKAHTEGLGIGLYLSRDIMRRQGGELWAESEGAGLGATFYFKIPAAK